METEGSLPCSQNPPSRRSCVTFLKKQTFLFLIHVACTKYCCDHETEQVGLEMTLWACIFQFISHHSTDAGWPREKGRRDFALYHFVDYQGHILQ
jgi:hypothetical protein